MKQKNSYSSFSNVVNRQFGELLKVPYIIIFLAIIACTSCSNDLVFSEITEIKANTWNQDSIINFNVEISADGIEANDSLETMIMVRHQGTYEYQNLWLFVDCLRPDSTIVKDTVNIYFADDFGRWLGNSGIGSLYTVTAALPKQRIDKEGIYVFSVTQGMRVENVNNISDIGINIYK